MPLKLFTMFEINAIAMEGGGWADNAVMTCHNGIDHIV